MMGGQWARSLSELARRPEVLPVVKTAFGSLIRGSALRACVARPSGAGVAAPGVPGRSRAGPGAGPQAAEARADDGHQGAGRQAHELLAGVADHPPELGEDGESQPLR